MSLIDLTRHQLGSRSQPQPSRHDSDVFVLSKSTQYESAVFEPQPADRGRRVDAVDGANSSNRFEPQPNRLNC